MTSVYQLPLDLSGLALKKTSISNINIRISIIINLYYMGMQFNREGRSPSNGFCSISLLSGGRSWRSPYLYTHPYPVLLPSSQSLMQLSSFSAMLPFFRLLSRRNTCTENMEKLRRKWSSMVRSFMGKVSQVTNRLKRTLRTWFGGLPRGLRLRP